MREQTKDEHHGDGWTGGVHPGEGDHEAALRDHQGDKQPDAPIQAFLERDFVGQDAAQRSGEESQQAERADRVTGSRDRQMKLGDVVGHGFRVDEEFHTESGGVAGRQEPGAVVLAGLHHRRKAFLAAIGHLPAFAKVRVVALRRILRELIVENGDDEHQNAGNDLSVAPRHSFRQTETEQGAEDQRHGRLREAGAGIAPTAGRRVGRADDVGGEHRRGVEFGHDERSPDDPDEQAKHQEGRVVPGESDPEHRDCSKSEQQRVGDPRSPAVAKRPDGEACKHGRNDAGDGDVFSICLAEVQVGGNDRHQRSRREPRIEANEAGNPGKMKGTHLHAI